MQDKKRNYIVRYPESIVQLNRSIVPIIFIICISGVLLFLIFAPIYFLLASILTNVLILTITYIGICIFASISALYAFLEYNSVKYVLKPGFIQKSKDQVIDAIPGKIEVSRGFISKRKTILSTDEIDRIEVKISTLGKIYNYADIYLEEVDKLTETKDFIITNVKNHKKAVDIIQAMIDLEKNQTQPAP